MEWETVIGLEVHVQLATNSKIFSNSPTKFGASPNSQASIIDLAFPGVLPVLNKEAVNMACKFGLAINAEIAAESIFARKNYFYPDLPKGYQISQHELPIVGKGKLEITLADGARKTINITRAHLEEDAGKSLHEDFMGCSGIDLNRAGVPLLEIVSEPDLRSAAEAVAYLKTLRSLVRYLEISDANMQEGSFRCDANVSVRKIGDPKLGTRSELKNINSFRFVERAIEYEVDRHIHILQSGGTIKQETRLYDADKNETRSMRSKEEAQDYRYFSDPDLLPVTISQQYLAKIKQTLPELPAAKFQRFCDEYQLSEYDANVLIASKELANYYEDALQYAPEDPKKVANWVTQELSALLNKHNLNIQESPVSSEEIGKLVAAINKKAISGKIAKDIFEKLWHKHDNIDKLIEKEASAQISNDDDIIKIVKQVIQDNPTQLEQYKAGKDKLFGFFVGQVMKISQGKANPAKVNAILKEHL